MSLNVDEAREAFRKDRVLNEILGEEFVDTYLKVNKVRCRDKFPDLLYEFSDRDVLVVRVVRQMKTLMGWTDEDEGSAKKRYIENW